MLKPARAEAAQRHHLGTTRTHHQWCASLPRRPPALAGRARGDQAWRASRLIYRAHAYHDRKREEVSTKAATSACWMPLTSNSADRSSSCGTASRPTARPQVRRYLAARDWLTSSTCRPMPPPTQPRRGRLVAPERIPGHPHQAHHRPAHTADQDPSETHPAPTRPAQQPPRPHPRTTLINPTFEARGLGILLL